MASSEFQQLATALLPTLPCHVSCTRADGGQLRISLIEDQAGGIFCHLDDPQARSGMVVTISVRTGDGGGYTIDGCLEQVYFISGLESAALLAITGVRRRKPYRTSERLEAECTATVRVRPPGARTDSPIHARVVDISKTGIGMTTQTRLSAGDRLSIAIHIPQRGLDLAAEATVARTAKLSFGRWQAGCEFTDLPASTRNYVATLTPATAQQQAA